MLRTGRDDYNDLNFRTKQILISYTRPGLQNSKEIEFQSLTYPFSYLNEISENQRNLNTFCYHILQVPIFAIRKNLHFGSI